MRKDFWSKPLICLVIVLGACQSRSAATVDNGDPSADPDGGADPLTFAGDDAFGGADCGAALDDAGQCPPSTPTLAPLSGGTLAVTPSGETVIAADS